MLSQCANSRCNRPFLQLGQGKLFLVEKEEMDDRAEPMSTNRRIQPRRLERYWLCDLCQDVWTLAHDLHRGIEVVPLPSRLGTMTVMTNHLTRPLA
jgi:hypothetical protein